MIDSTTTKTGLVVKCNHDAKVYECGIKVSDEDFENVAIVRDELIPKWNYTIKGFKDPSLAKRADACTLVTT